MIIIMIIIIIMIMIIIIMIIIIIIWSGRDRLPALPGESTLPGEPANPGCCLHFSMCACHPCAGAMLIFSVSFQF